MTAATTHQPPLHSPQPPICYDRLGSCISDRSTARCAASSSCAPASRAVDVAHRQGSCLQSPPGCPPPGPSPAARAPASKSVATRFVTRLQERCHHLRCLQERHHLHRCLKEHLLMSMKCGSKKAQGRRRIPEPALHPYQLVRLRECMKNHARLKELGLPDHYYNRLLAEDVAGHSDKNQSEDIHSDKYDHGDSESEYDPLQDDNGEEGLIDHDNAKCSKEKTCKKTNNQTTSMRPGGVKFQSRKRVFADQTSPRVITRSKKNTAQQDASLTPSDICVPPPSGANESHTRELVGNLDEGTQAAAEGQFYYHIT
ncbi:uncharacterized protein LOC110436429 [Sorghum bicolor]|uniref:uncharacterized protein LOC110436429 n=1 Tax=Sorghum bicolor TaxID=4558 RepID=UPI000B426C14|nr:uncharacterized protein LOC110436429 [Sorghum bicolor]|eukprot:XP_021319203.1 uncharacterized protein LOC110436429 [Sorghum bicolor]